jgi:hypothetical protein
VSAIWRRGGICGRPAASCGLFPTGQSLDSGLDLAIDLESAAFLFHMSAMTRANRRVLASRVF